MRIVTLCTGNICRSPMAEALLRGAGEVRGLELEVSSAGLLAEPRPADPHAVTVMAERGLDISGHLSREMTPDLLVDADLLVAMARMHLRSAVLVDPGVFSRTFTLKELVRRGEEAGGRAADEPLADWLARIADGRAPAELLGDAAVDDVADPIGSGRKVFRRTAEELSDLVDRVGVLLWP